MKYIDADKIKAEIERLRHEWPPTFTEGEKQHLHYYFHGLNKVLRFVESMQQEELTQGGNSGGGNGGNQQGGELEG